MDGVLPHTPPGVPSVSGIVDAAQTCVGPAMAAGSGFTVTVLDRVQPVGDIEHVIVATPGTKPATMPLDVPTVAIPGALLFQVTPADDVSGIVEPTQTVDGPPITVGSGLTVTGVVVEQPAPKE